MDSQKHWEKLGSDSILLVMLQKSVKKVELHKVLISINVLY